MTTCIVLLSVFLIAIGLGQPIGQPGDFSRPGGPEGLPPFLNNVSEDARNEFFDILHNDNLTISQIDTETAAWAVTNNVSDVYIEFEANRTARLAELKQNVTSIIANLPSVQSQLEAIMDNKDQTRAAQHEQIDALRQKYSQEVGIIVQLARPSRGGPGGPKGLGKPRGPSGHIGLPRAN